MWIIVLKVSRVMMGGGVKGKGRGEQCAMTHLLLNLALTHYLITSRVIPTVQGLHFFCNLKNCDKIHIT